MLNRIFQLYHNAFGGLSRPAWMLACIMFVNRSGAMVIPFLSLYLMEFLDFSLEETGFVLSMFGLGAMGGSFLGGWLSDRFGHFWVQVVSLMLGGLLFFLLSDLHQFEHVAIGVFILSLVTESLSPANASSVVHYTKPENVTRALSLNRMAVNLGFSIGPALGGLLASLSYRWLFVADGATCIAAGIFFFLYFRNFRGTEPVKQKVQALKPAASSPYKDVTFLFFIFFCTCFAIIFFQYFVTLPLYYRQVYQLTEGSIGGILAFNGLMVFLLEMVVVYVLGKRLSKALLIKMGLVVMGLSFVLLNMYQHVSILFVAMLLLVFAEILAMPFMASLTVERSSETNRGAYMGLYTLTWAVAHILAPYLGTSILSRYNFEVLWWVTGIASLITGLGLYVVVQAMERQRQQVLQPQWEPEPQPQWEPQFQSQWEPQLQLQREPLRQPQLQPVNAVSEERTLV